VKVTIGVSLDNELNERLNKYAQKWYVSRSKVVQWALREYFAAYERAVKKHKESEEK